MALQVFRWQIVELRSGVDDFRLVERETVSGPVASGNCGSGSRSRIRIHGDNLQLSV